MTVKQERESKISLFRNVLQKFACLCDSVEVNKISELQA